MEQEKTSCDQKNRSSAINFDSLRFKKCLFMTDEQLNKSKIHKPANSLFIEELIKVNSTADVDNKIKAIIDNIHGELKKKYNSNVKIPHPVFVILGRELEYDSSLFDIQTFEHKPKIMETSIKYGNTEIPVNNNKIVILDYIKGFFKSGLSNKEDDYKYKSSIINSYKFKGRVRIFLYVPFLKQNYTFIPNLNDLTTSFYFFNTIMNSDFYMNISRTSTFDADKARKEWRKAKLDEKTIDNIINFITSIDKKKYSLYDDLINLCFDGGCISDVGDDFNSLIPPYTDDDDTNNKNASDKSPFMPNKCLSKTNGFLCNVRFANRNKDIHNFLNKNALKEIQENLSEYTLISDKIQKSQNLNNEESEYLSRYKSPVNLIVAVINNFIKKYYSNNLNDDDDKYNHYSKIYSENIIKELAFLKKMNGIPEFVMSLYFLKEKDEYFKDKIAYMPFVDVFPTAETIFNFGDILMVDEILYSSNKKYGMKLNSNGLVPVFNIETNQILYFLNKEVITNPTDMTIQENGLLISFTNEQGNLIKRNYLFKLSSLVDNCKFCKPPFSLVIKDDGFLCIYGNGFYDSTSKEFKDFINDEINFIKKLENGGNSVDMNNISSTRRSLNENSINKEINYLYCSPNSSGCKK